MHNATVTEAHERFSALLEQVEQGEIIQILDGEKPIGRLVPVSANTAAQHRIGFLKGQGHVPPNWKELGRDQDEVLLGGE